MKNSEKTLDMIVNLCKNRGYVYAGSEIYGGLANSWDYGPLGVEFKNNVKKAWLKKFVQESDYNVGLDAAIIMNPQTWVTTGHVGNFSDPLVDCKGCGSRQRADKLIEAAESGKSVNVDAMSFDEMDAFIASHEDVVCPNCGKHNFTAIRKFNLMFKTQIGVTEDTRDRTGHLCQLCQHPAHPPPQAALRRLSGWQGLPQRDHPRQFHLPYPGI